MLACVAASAVQAQTGAELNQLVDRLREGGYVLVMRHASSPREAPAREQANTDNLRLERQLDAAGRQHATEMGEAFRRLRIPLGTVSTSPTYRAMETVRLARFAPVVTVDELGDSGQSMQGVSEAQAEWLRKKAAEVPSSGNTLIVTHQPNLSRAFSEWGATVADGEVVVLRPDGRGAFTLVARVPIERWAGLR